MDGLYQNIINKSVLFSRHVGLGAWRPLPSKNYFAPTGSPQTLFSVFQVEDKLIPFCFSVDPQILYTFNYLLGTTGLAYILDTQFYQQNIFWHWHCIGYAKNVQHYAIRILYIIISNYISKSLLFKYLFINHFKNFLFLSIRA